eukprot:952026-Ditylum_brightwellii.AAC.1
MAITDVSVNAHIFNDKNLFIGDIMAMDPTTGVETIGGIDHKPQGIGLVEIEWKDDEGATHTYKLQKH